MEKGEFVKGAWYSCQEDDQVGVGVLQLKCEMLGMQERMMDLDERTRTIESYLSDVDQCDLLDEDYFEETPSLWPIIIISMIVSATVVGIMTVLKTVFL